MPISGDFVFSSDNLARNLAIWLTILSAVFTRLLIAALAYTFQFLVSILQVVLLPVYVAILLLTIPIRIALLGVKIALFIAVFALLFPAIAYEFFAEIMSNCVSSLR
ncbi:unnamed protein product [Callosobruchus maculatus]|uniref:Uncharacterized protein n=1 Tax=Callosobruchus maculatus TaxID=64391 RepID=A0A653DLR5_CALMS|nr:unnamed protein product [Callosobruchus maculatus]